MTFSEFLNEAYRSLRAGRLKLDRKMIEENPPHICFKSIEAAALWCCMLRGQISDGRWENVSSEYDWRFWLNAIVHINASEVGYATELRKPDRKYNFTDKQLLDVVGDDMVNIINNADKMKPYFAGNTLDETRFYSSGVRRDIESNEPENPKYTMKDLKKFLNECKDATQNYLGKQL